MTTRIGGVGTSVVAAAALLLGAIVPFACQRSDTCTFADGCGHGCQTNSDCDDAQLSEEGLTCQAIPGQITSPGFCTIPCTDGSQCRCVCGDSPDRGWCTPGTGPASQPWTCRNDMPSMVVACQQVCLWYDACTCSSEESCLAECNTWHSAHAACSDQLDALMLCAYRNPYVCTGDGLRATETCATQIDAVSTCAGTSFGMFVPHTQCP